MKTKEITVNYSRTLNLGNYESLKIELGETVTLDAKEKANEVRTRVLIDLRKEVSAFIKPIRESRK